MLNCHSGPVELITKISRVLQGVFEDSRLGDFEACETGSTMRDPNGDLSWYCRTNRMKEIMEASKSRLTHERQEQPVCKEIFIQTEKGLMRGELIDRSDYFLVIAVKYTHDGVGVNTFMKIDRASLRAGKPMKFSLSTDSGKTFGSEKISAPLKKAGICENGIFVTVNDLIERAECSNMSRDLLENSTADEGLYSQKLTEYSYHEEALAYTQAFPKEAKFNFVVSDSIGWKTHLNVAPKDVVAVSAYLKKNGYYHKYLYGGCGTEGKVFTVYFGAKSIMDRWSQRLSQDLAGLLCRPKIVDETEIATGITGRFVDEPQARAKQSQEAEFTKYGWYGMPLRVQYIRDKNQGRLDLTSPTLNKKEAAIDAYKRLSELFGSYFHG